LSRQDRIGSAEQASKDLDAGQLVRRLDMIDERLDNMDSVVTSLVERVMARPLVMEVTCPSCGQIVQVSVTSGVRFRGKE
jgi:hypothetical protein